MKHFLSRIKKIPTTMGSNTGFLGENPIRKGKIHTTYGFFLCTQFSPNNNDGKSNAEEMSKIPSYEYIMEFLSTSKI